MRLGRHFGRRWPNRPVVSGGGGDPAITPAVTKWAVEGTSLEADGYALAGALVELDAEYQNFSVGGSTTAGMTARLSTVSAADCDGAVFGTGAPNDLMTAWGSDSAALAGYLAYAASLKTAVSGGPVGIRGIAPLDESQHISQAGFNARRAYVNAGLRAAAGGGTIDFYIPAGEHPETSYDDAANLEEGGGTGDYPDGLHPAFGSATVVNETAAAVAAIGAVIAQAGLPPETSPDDFTFTDNAAAPLSTEIVSRVMVTGLGMGQSVSASIASGPGTIQRGYAAAGAGPISGVMAGDVISATIVSSASNETAISGTYNIGDQSDTFTVTTIAASGEIARDDFDRANGALGTTPIGGFTWYGNAVIDSNKFTLGQGAYGYGVFDPAAGYDLDITWTDLVIPGSGLGMPFPMFWGVKSGTGGDINDLGRYFYLDLANGLVRLHHELPAEATIGSFTAPSAGAHTIRVVLTTSPREIAIYIDGSLIHTVTTASDPSGFFGLYPATGTFLGVWDQFNNTLGAVDEIVVEAVA